MHTRRHKIIKAFSGILTGILVLSLTPLWAAPPRNLEDALSKLDTQIQNIVQKKQIPGCAVAVVYQNKIVFMHAYGVRTLGTQERIDLNTVFQLGSVSKPIAATLASILEHKGLLHFEDPVYQHLPNFALKTKQAPHMFKIKHILSHSTGVSRGGFNNLIESHMPYDHILEALQKAPVRTAIGKRYDYHNAMYSLISEITRKATRLPFKDALHANLLEPLNMTMTSATFGGLLRTANRASPHTRGYGGRLIPSPTYSQGYYTVAPAGGINSSIRDMAIFLKAQLGGHPEVLNPKMLARMHAPQISTPSSISPCEGSPQLIKNPSYALGWRVVDFDHHKLIFHGGWVKGFTNFIAFMPEEQIGIVVLHNSEATGKFSAKTAVKFFESYLGIPRHKKSFFSFVSRKKVSHPKKKFDLAKKISLKNQNKKRTKKLHS